jgi:hypothetical protein
MRRVMSLLFVAAVVAAVPAQAQNEEPPHLLPFEVHVGGGYTFSMSSVRQYLGDGYHVNTGLTLSLTPVLGFQVEYSYNGLGKKTVNVPGGTLPSGVTVVPVSADMNMQYGNFNLVVRPPTRGRVKPYLISGVGVYYRPVKVTAPTAGYVPGYCYPYYYVCYPGGAVVVDQTLASATTTGFGIDVGGGMFVLMSREAGGGFYIESRYHYMWGPELKDDQGVSHGKANGQFLPITIGLRF